MFKKEKFIAKFVRRKEGDIDNRNTFFPKKIIFFPRSKLFKPHIPIYTVIIS